MSKPDPGPATPELAADHARPDASSPTGDALRRWLNQQTERYDASTLQQLGRARRTAVAEAGQAAGRRQWRLLVSAAAASLCLALVLALQLSPLSHEAVPPAPASMETFMMLASPESEDMLDSMDFYLWLESEEIDGDDRAG